MVNFFPKKKQSQLDFNQIELDEFPKGELWEFTLDLGENTVAHKKIESRGCEFLSVHPCYVGKEHRYLYMNASRTPTENGPLQALMKLDKVSGVKQIWSGTEREFPGEPIFVPHPDGINEDDGWLISMVYDATKHYSYLIILNAQDINQEIAKLSLKHHVPHGFHGNWTSKIFIKQ